MPKHTLHEVPTMETWMVCWFLRAFSLLWSRWTWIYTNWSCH